MYVPAAIPSYPVSSLNSLTALSSACSPSSTRPAGTSITTLLMGGRNCFCNKSSGPDGFRRIAIIPTPSIGDFLGRVERSADSQVRCLPKGSVYVVLGPQLESTSFWDAVSSDKQDQLCPAGIFNHLPLLAWGREAF